MIYNYPVYCNLCYNKNSYAQVFLQYLKNNSIGMKQQILRNWNFMRFIRLVLGVAIIMQAIYAKDWTMGIFGVLFTCMPIFNFGCCNACGRCTPAVNKTPQTIKDITYEEVV